LYCCIFSYALSCFCIKTESTSSGSSGGAAIGGAIGGVVVAIVIIILVVVVIVWIRRKQTDVTDYNESTKSMQSMLMQPFICILH